MNTIAPYLPLSLGVVAGIAGVLYATHLWSFWPGIPAGVWFGLVVFIVTDIAVCYATGRPW